jgi:hypothetical protein
MAEVRKFSLAYDAQEDRIAWDSEDADGTTMRLWLTQRLCRGLVAAILPMLEAAAPQQVAPQHQATAQSWEQAAALSDFGKSPSVRPTPQSASGLVRAVHLRPSAQEITFLFEFGAGASCSIGVRHAGVRQMLFVLRRLYAGAGWPADFWPAWISPTSDPPAPEAVN